MMSFGYYWILWGLSIYPPLPVEVPERRLYRSWVKHGRLTPE